RTGHQRCAARRPADEAVRDRRTGRGAGAVPVRRCRGADHRRQSVGRRRLDRGVTILVAAAALLACTGAPAETPAGSAPCPERKPAASDWRRQATSIDRDRLRRWRDAWQDALTKIRASGGEGELLGYGPLLQPDVALTGPVPPIGTYACRVVKLGARIEG